MNKRKQSHFDIVKEKAGKKAQQKFFKKRLSIFDYVPDLDAVVLDEVDVEEQDLNYELVKFYLTVFEFVRKDIKTHKVSKNRILLLKDFEKDILTSRIPKYFEGYLTFPAKTINQGNDFIEGAYVSLGYRDRNFISSDGPVLMLQIFCIFESKNDKACDPRISWSEITFNDHTDRQSIEGSLLASEQGVDEFSLLGCSPEVCKTIINTICFLDGLKKTTAKRKKKAA